MLSCSSLYNTIVSRDNQRLFGFLLCKYHVGSYRFLNNHPNGWASRMMFSYAVMAMMFILEITGWHPIACLQSINYSTIDHMNYAYSFIQFIHNQDDNVIVRLIPNYLPVRKTWVIFQKHYTAPSPLYCLIHVCHQTELWTSVGTLIIGILLNKKLSNTILTNIYPSLKLRNHRFTEIQKCKMILYHEFH